jgi:hypothetical protein
LVAPAVFACCLAFAGPAFALDVFTLWQRPEAPLSLAVGDRVDYQTSIQESGRRTTDLVRLQCVEDTERGWWLEILPLTETAAGLMPTAGEGVRLLLDHEVVTRSGDLPARVLRVERWQAGVVEVLEGSSWREDPLVKTSLQAGFSPDTVERQGGTTRVVGEADLLCSQFTLVERDTTRIELPRGTLLQITKHEVSAAVHPDIPFLGVAFAAERVETRSVLDPPGGRRAPPPELRIETMELIDFGRDAKSRLGVR